MNTDKAMQIRSMVKNIIGMRDDLSPYLVHLTRMYEGQSAIDNLVSIITTKTIEARNMDAYFKYKFPEELTNLFKVMSLTESPLKQLKNIVKIPYRRKINLEPYGVAFNREYIIQQKKGVPVYYIYNDEQKNYFDHLVHNFQTDSTDRGGDISNHLF